MVREVPIIYSWASLFKIILMKDNSFSDGRFLLIVGFTLMFIFIACLLCSGQSYNCFNYKDDQKGIYCIKIDTDSISIQESFPYHDNLYYGILYNNWEETVTLTYYGQECFEVYTTEAQWIFFYCEDDTSSYQVCEMYYRPIIGETLHYQKLLR